MNAGARTREAGHAALGGDPLRPCEGWREGRQARWEPKLLGTFRRLARGLQGGLGSMWNPGLSAQPLEEEPWQEFTDASQRQRVKSTGIGGDLRTTFPPEPWGYTDVQAH